MGPNLIALAIPLFFLGMGIELIAMKVKKRPLYRPGDAMGSMATGITQQLVSLFVATTVLTGTYTALSKYAVIELPTKWLPWVVAILGVEFAYYWWHRLSHEVNLMWAAHVVHHHSEDYNLSTALRQSVTTWITTMPFYLPLALLGVPVFHFAVILGLSTLYQFWIHTELVGPLGFLEKWINTPALHRVHHAINPRYLDKNHSGTFAFFDRMFGTWEPETEACVYGTTRPINSYNPMWSQVEGYVDLWKLSRRAPTFGKAVKVWFASPAWREEWMGPYTARDHAVKYDPQPSQRTSSYVLANWFVVLGGVFIFLMWGSTLGTFGTLAVVALILASLMSLPALMEGRPWARGLEIARLIAVPIVAVVCVLGL